MNAPIVAVMPIQKWKAKQIAEIDRYPRQIEQRDRTKSAQKRADAVEVSHRPGAVVAQSRRGGSRTIV